MAEYIAPVFYQGELIVAVGFRRAADGGWELAPQIYPEEVGVAVDDLAYGVVVLYERTNGAWFALNGEALSPLGPKSAALLDDDPDRPDPVARPARAGSAHAVGYRPDRSRDRFARGNRTRAHRGPWFWLTAGAAVFLVVAIVLQMMSVRRRRKRQRRHIPPPRLTPRSPPATEMIAYTRSFRAIRVL